MPLAQRARFLDAMHKMVNDLKAGQPFRPGLRVKRVQKVQGVNEMTWADDGRAIFEMGVAVVPGEVHII